MDFLSSLTVKEIHTVARKEVRNTTLIDPSSGRKRKSQSAINPKNFTRTGYIEYVLQVFESLDVDTSGLEKKWQSALNNSRHQKALDRKEKMRKSLPQRLKRTSATQNLKHLMTVEMSEWLRVGQIVSIPIRIFGKHPDRLLGLIVQNGEENLHLKSNFISPYDVGESDQIVKFRIRSILPPTLETPFPQPRLEIALLRRIIYPFVVRVIPK